MSVTKYGPATHIFIVNNRKVVDWSNDDEPLQLSQIDPKRELDIHHGGGGVLVERINEGRTARISLRPGSADSAFFSGLYNTGDILEATMITIGTNEKVLLSGGTVNEMGDIGRGFRPSNDNYSMDFLKFVPVMGGDA